VENFRGYNEKCVQLYRTINEYHAAGFSKLGIARLLRISYPTVNKNINGDFETLCRKTRRSCMDVYQDYIVKSLMAGTSRSDIYKNLVTIGFKRSHVCAYNYMNKLIAHHGIEVSVYKTYSADAIKRQKLIKNCDYITRTELFKFLWMNLELPSEYRDHIFAKYPQLYELYVCIKEFRQIFDTGRSALLHLFIEKYKQSGINALATFAKGLDKDIEAVENAVSCNLSNGFVEGTVNKLKTTKRSMYGRCSRELLAAKMMYSPNSS